MATIQQFISKHCITMTPLPGVKESQVPEDFQDSTAWTCVLRYKKHKLSVPFFMGKGHNGKSPSIGDVLYCLQSDAASIMSACSFEDWASDFGYDTDSRKAEKIYRACENQTNKLRRFFADDFMFEEFLQCEE